MKIEITKEDIKKARESSRSSREGRFHPLSRAQH